MSDKPNFHLIAGYFQTVRPEDLSTVSSPMTGHMSKFSLLCQAGRLLGQVLHYLSSAVAIPDDVWMQLDRTLQSMLAAALNIDRPDFDQIAFVYRWVIPYTPRSLTPAVSPDLNLHH